MGGGAAATTQETQTVKLMYTNAQSVLNKVKELAAYVVEAEPDIIFLTETWCSSTTNNAALALPNYQLESELRRDRTDTGNGVGGGLLIYVKLGLKILPYDKFDDNTFNQFCCFKMITEGEPLHCILIYRPPSSNLANLLKLCDMMRNLDKNTYVVGDFNIPNVNWQEWAAADPKGRTLLTTMEEAGLTQMVNLATHTKGNVLDLFITNNPDKVIGVSDGGRLGRSDHCILNIELVANPQKVIHRGRRPNWNKADTIGLKTQLSGINWQRLLSTNNTVEQNWQNFKKVVSKSVRENVPESTCKPSTQPRWITREIIRLLGQKKRLWKNLKLHPTVDNEGKYRKIEKEVSAKIRNAKRSIEKRLANSHNTNARSFANYIKSKTKAVIGIGPLKRTDGTLATEDKEIADMLNEFFASVFSVTNSNINRLLTVETVAELSLVRFTERQISNKIKRLKESSAGGPDGINARVLKTAEAELVGPLGMIFDQSMKEGQVPVDWRAADVVPIYKKGPKGEPGNYRPISLTSIPGKLMEGVIKDSLMTHLIENNLIRDSQHGFMPGRSCTTNLLIFMDKVTEAVDQGHPVDIFYLDFSKAFDKVPHDLLILKLRAKGVAGETLRWIKNWLADRTQQV